MSSAEYVHPQLIEEKENTIKVLQEELQSRPTAEELQESTHLVMLLKRELEVKRNLINTMNIHPSSQTLQDKEDLVVQVLQCRIMVIKQIGRQCTYVHWD